MGNRGPQGDWEDLELMTCSEVADFLRVHYNSVRRWSRSGKLKAFKVGSRGDWRYRYRDVLDFLFAQNQPSREAGGPDDN